MANTDIAKAEKREIVEFKTEVMTPEELAEYQEEMDGLNAPSFKRVKTPSGGATSFEVPTGIGDETDPKKVLRGVVLHHHPLNRYYKDPMGEGDKEDKTPDCSSIDNKIGVNKEGEAIECATCPLNEYGSDPKGGKACSNRHAIYMLCEGDMLPTLLEAPPTSLRPFGSYVQSLFVGRHTRSSGCVTEFSVTKEKNKGGQEFSMLHFEFKGFLSDESARDTKALGEQVKSKVMDDAIRRVDRARKDEDVVEIEKDGTFEGGETTPVIPVE